jgi:hypothetical protein
MSISSFVFDVLVEPGIGQLQWERHTQLAGGRLDKN